MKGIRGDQGKKCQRTALSSAAAGVLTHRSIADVISGHSQCPPPALSTISVKDQIMRQIVRILAVIGFLNSTLWAGDPVEGSLDVGDLAPQFQCRDDQGQIWDARDCIGKKVVVIYFYSGDFNFCSTRQALKFRDGKKALEIHGAEVIGISGDSSRAHQLFKETHQLTQTLLSDSDGSVARQFGVPCRKGGKAMVKSADDKEVLDSAGQAFSIPRTVTTASWTFVVDEDGRIIYREQDVSAVKDCQKVLDFLCNREKKPDPGKPNRQNPVADCDTVSTLPLQFAYPSPGCLARSSFRRLALSGLK
jgi:thioredoxin-dependent peroxiredoxin